MLTADYKVIVHEGPSDAFVVLSNGLQSMVMDEKQAAEVGLKLTGAAKRLRILNAKQEPETV
jgi:hypothetical protein